MPPVTVHHTHCSQGTALGLQGHCAVTTAYGSAASYPQENCFGENLEQVPTFREQGPLVLEALLCACLYLLVCLCSTCILFAA